LDHELGVEPERPPYRPGDRDDLPLIAFVADPDGYRVELIDGGVFVTPQDGPHRAER
jgi:lactoylglutathione lyase